MRLCHQNRLYMAEVIEALDVRLLACHNVLLEDLSPAILAEFLENPGLLQRAPDAPSSDLAGEKRRCIEDVWMDMYGDSNLPILKPEAKAEGFQWVFAERDVCL